MLEFYPSGNLSSSGGMTATFTTTTLTHHHSHDHENTIQTEIIGYNVRDIASHIKCEKTYAKCNGCDKKIHDRYIMRMNDIHHMINGTWHENCLSCSMCGTPLSDRCYTRNDKLYCLTDYKKKFGAKCTRCGIYIEKNEKVMIVNNYKFHLHCFTCETCFHPLQKGEQFVVQCGQLYCRHDFEKILYMKQCHDDDLLDDAIRPRDGRRGPKRPRTILTSAQRRQFKSSFETSPKPCRKVREALAKDTGLSVRVVQVWFQNQRAKMKKIQRKSKQDGDKGLDKDGIKEEKGIKQESPSSDHNHYLLSNSFEQPLNPNNTYLSDDFPHSNDSMSESDTSLDDYVDNCDDATSDTLSLQNVDIQTGGLGHNHNNSLCSIISAVNPIDKLYLMQANYFHPEQ